MKNKKTWITIITLLIGFLTAGLFYIQTGDTGNTIKIVTNTVVNIIEDNQSTKEIPELTQEDEETLEYQETEKEGFELQGEIAYNGSGELPNVAVGGYAGLTYFSQIDSRWKNLPYTSTGNKTQTMGSSACGPTCSAMIVSSIKGNILPTTLADLYVEYGFRSANNGTYWSAFRWTADVFDIEYTETIYLNTLCDLLEQNYMAITGCGNGLFTTGGHFIVIYGFEDTNGDGQCDVGDKLKVYDPYLYSGKFETSTRRGKAIVEGNTVLVEKEVFREYANYGTFFCFKNDRTDVKENTATVTETQVQSTVSSVNYQVKVTANSGLNIRSGASTSYSKIGGYTKGTIVTITAENNGWGKTDKGWICLSYTTKVSTLINTVGQVKVFKSATTIYSNSNLSGTKYQYLKNTSVTILQNLGNIDKVKVRATGRIGYVNISVYK